MLWAEDGKASSPEGLLARLTGRRELPPGYFGNLATAATLTAAIIIVAVCSYYTYRYLGQDFRGYYAAARVLALGGDPYDFRQIGATLTSSADMWSDHRFYYPPWLAVALIPLGLMAYETARLVWLVFNVVTLLIGGWLWRRNEGWPPWDWRAYLLAIGVLYPLVWVALQAEQLTIALAMCLGLAGLRGSRRADLLAGVGMALLLTKPNVTFGPLLLLGLVMLRERRWWALGTVAGTSAALFTIGTLAVPFWWERMRGDVYSQALWNLLGQEYTVVGVRLHATLQDWLTRYGLPSWLLPAGTAAALLLLAALAWLAIRGRLTANQAIGWGMLATFLATPYAYEYDYVLLAPLIVMLWHGTSGLRRRRLAAALILWGAFYTVQKWGFWMSDAYWIPLIFLAIGMVTGQLPALFRDGTAQTEQAAATA